MPSSFTARTSGSSVAWSLHPSKSRGAKSPPAKATRPAAPQPHTRLRKLAVLTAAQGRGPVSWQTGTQTDYQLLGIRI